MEAYFEGYLEPTRLLRGRKPCTLPVLETRNRPAGPHHLSPDTFSSFRSSNLEKQVIKHGNDHIITSIGRGREFMLHPLRNMNTAGFILVPALTHDKLNCGPEPNQQMLTSAILCVCDNFYILEFEITTAGTLGIFIA